jgi:hypothetical protein
VVSKKTLKHSGALLEGKSLKSPKHGSDQVVLNKTLKAFGVCSVANPLTPETQLISGTVSNKTLKTMDAES